MSPYQNYGMPFKGDIVQVNTPKSEYNTKWGRVIQVMVETVVVKFLNECLTVNFSPKDLIKERD